jgi:hypothetical protein
MPTLPPLNGIAQFTGEKDVLSPDKGRLSLFIAILHKNTSLRRGHRCAASRWSLPCDRSQDADPTAEPHLVSFTRQGHTVRIDDLHDEAYVPALRGCAMLDGLLCFTYQFGKRESLNVVLKRHIMVRSPVLAVDAFINLLLGGLLIPFPERIVAFLGIPTAAQAFYPSILGAVLFGIGIALVVELRRQREGPVGLGLGGAVAINLSGGIVLAVWLLSGELSLPLRGHVILWSLVVIVVAISAIELYVHSRTIAKDAGK